MNFLPPLKPYWTRICTRSYRRDIYVDISSNLYASMLFRSGIAKIRRINLRAKFFELFFRFFPLLFSFPNLFRPALSAKADANVERLSKPCKLYLKKAPIIFVSRVNLFEINILFEKRIYTAANIF